MQGALAAAFPQCTDLSSDAGRGISAFTPHLSLGQWRTPAEVAAAQQRLVASWQAATFRAGGVAIIARQGFDDPFSVQWFVPFGGREPVAVGAPYIATVGEPCGSQLGSSDGGVSMAAAELVGIGAARADGSVWNFAYGANMCPSKLNGARSLHPLESAPARVPNWRLSFTHRGGMVSRAVRAHALLQLAPRLDAACRLLFPIPGHPQCLFGLPSFPRPQGNLVPLAPGETSPAGLGAVHGVLHRLSPADYGKLACMEHEYRWGGRRWAACKHPALPSHCRVVQFLPRCHASIFPPHACVLPGVWRRPIEVQAQPYGSDETVAAVAFVTPEAARIAEGLPPPQR